MFREKQKKRSSSAGFPRVCGDVPRALTDATQNLGFSPRMRGCSSAGQRVEKAPTVFPAYAGMFPSFSRIIPLSVGFPRVCGDVPAHPAQGVRLLKFSPRMRGCSLASNNDFCIIHVFPAYAGMFRLSSRFARSVPGFPRVCGDVPTLERLTNDMQAFSPRMRGCSASSWWLCA